MNIKTTKSRIDTIYYLYYGDISISSIFQNTYNIDLSNITALSWKNSGLYKNEVLNLDSRILNFNDLMVSYKTDIKHNAFKLNVDILIQKLNSISSTRFGFNNTLYQTDIPIYIIILNAFKTLFSNIVLIAFEIMNGTELINLEK